MLFSNSRLDRLSAVRQYGSLTSAWILVCLCHETSSELLAVISDTHTLNANFCRTLQLMTLYCSPLLIAVSVLLFYWALVSLI